MLNSVAVYLHTEIALSDRRLSAARPNTLLGLIPVGTSRSNFPIESIAGVTAATLFSVPAFLVGLMAGLAGFLGLSSPGNTGGGVLLLVLGLLLIISAPRQAIAVMNSGGGVIRFPVAVFERGRTVEFANRVSEALARTPRHSVALTQAVNATAPNARDALANLNRLRDEGLIDAQEYASKRTEILARL
jgi:hypothetical protein